MFTLINTIYRKEKRELKSTVADMKYRYYDVYLAYIALRVRLLDFRDHKGIDEAIDDIKNSIESITGNDLSKLVMKEVVNIKKISKIERYKAITSVYNELQFNSLSPIFNAVYGDTTANMISRYISNPYLDQVEPYYKLVNTQCIVEL